MTMYGGNLEAMHRCYIRYVTKETMGWSSYTHSAPSVRSAGVILPGNPGASTATQVS